MFALTENSHLHPYNSFSGLIVCGRKGRRVERGDFEQQFRSWPSRERSSPHRRLSNPFGKAPPSLCPLFAMLPTLFAFRIFLITRQSQQGGMVGLSFLSLRAIPLEALEDSTIPPH